MLAELTQRECVCAAAAVTYRHLMPECQFLIDVTYELLLGERVADTFAYGTFVSGRVQQHRI